MEEKHFNLMTGFIDVNAERTRNIWLKASKETHKH